MNASAHTGARGTMRNVFLLSAGQAIIGSQQALIMAIAALVGVVLAPDPIFATVPTSTMVIGLALSAGPAAMLSHRLGRTRAFMIGASIGVCAGLLAAGAIILSSFVLFSLALFIAGGAAAIGQQYRFAAADSVPAEVKGKAISWVLAGGVLAGFIGPGMAYWGRNWIGGAEYAGSFLALAGLASIGIGVLSRTHLPKAEVHAASGSGRPILDIVRSPAIFVPIVTGMASYGLMTFVMVAAPLAMVVICGHPKDAATFAIQWHIIAMFAPSFFTGSIISRIGAGLTTAIGLTLILACAVTALSGTSIGQFDLALILLGLGWNFGFIGSTTLLAQGYRPEDAARAQAVNEQLVFGVMAVASIGSGVLVNAVGWQAINIAAIPVVLVAVALLAWRTLLVRDYTPAGE